MSETLLDMVQAACGELVLPVPSSVIVPSDGFATNMLYMAQQAGRELARTYEWGDLITTTSFPTVASQTDYPLEPDFFRMINDTSWDTSTNWRIAGPLTPQAYQFLLDSQIANFSIYRQFQLIGRTAIRIFPTPPDATGVFVYQYLSRAWVNGSAGRAMSFAADTDTTVFDFDLMVKELKWRWMFAKGQDAAEFRQERDDALALLIAADQGGTVLDMRPGSDDCEEGQVSAYSAPNFILSTNNGEGILVD